MTTTTQELEDMRLPDLWSLFRQVRGESTRCPNRPYLIRVIREGLRGAPVIALPEPEPEPAPEPEEAPASTGGAEASDVQERAPSSDDEAAEAPADAPALARDESDADETEAADGETDASATLEGSERGRLVSMTVDELQMKYFEVVGRPTASEDKAYLVWKIRQAQRGKVTVGPARRAATEGEPVEFKVLPLRFTATSVDQMDAIWRALEMRSRSDFVRTAIDAYVKSLASRPAAAAVSEPGPASPR
jgi:hypothetical protein